MAAAGRLLAVLACGALAGGAAAPSAFDLAGRYTRIVYNGDISGARYTTLDTVLVIPTGRAQALIDLQLSFFNGHECSVGGIAGLEGARLVYRGTEPGFEARVCTLSVWREGARLRWDDDGGSCQGYCGARGTLADGAMRWSSRRRIPAAERRRILAEHERERDLP